MRMTIYETGHYYSPGRIHHDRLPRQRQVFHPPGWPHLTQLAVADEDRSILNDCQFFQRAAAPRFRRSPQRQKLPGPAYKNSGDVGFLYLSY